MNEIETISYKGHEIGIYYDEYAETHVLGIICL